MNAVTQIGDEAQPGPLKVFLVAGEPSGDNLGGALAKALKAHAPYPIEIKGTGGDAMEKAGVSPLYPLSDVSVMGFADVVPALPRIIRRAYSVIGAIEEFEPDVLVIIDSPDYTHEIAKRVRKRLPALLIVDYVAPTVWAWRSGRARAMRRYLDAVLALFPFEPDAFQRLNGPECHYVGHPLIERRELLPDPGGKRDGDRRTILLLPGSRANEIRRHMAELGKAASLILERHPEADFVLPAVAAQRTLIEKALETWRVKPRLVIGDDGRYAAFRTAHCAIAASGTVTLELAIARVPMVVIYAIDWYLEIGRRYFLRAPSIVLANLIGGENVVPELVYRNFNAERVAQEAAALIGDTPERSRQLALFEKVAENLGIGGDAPSQRAARVVFDLVSSRS